MFIISHSPLNAEGTADNTEMEVGVANSDSTHSGGLDVPSAMKLIHNPDGRRVSARAEQAPTDAYSAFLMLRHLKIREERNKVV